MWTFSVSLLLVFTHLRDFGVNAVIEDNSINNHEIESINISDTPENCIFVSSQTGYFTYKSTTNSTTVCGIYLVSSSQSLIEVTFTKFDVPCDSNEGEGGLVQYLDGWELQKEVFPSLEDVSRNPEDTEFCSDRKPSHKTFISSQNGAQITYRIPHIGKGFTILVNHRKHPSPCNIIHFDEPYYLLENHGKKRSCSIWASYPTAIQFNSYTVGSSGLGALEGKQCAHAEDRIEIGGGSLDTNRIQIVGNICGKSKAAVAHEDFIVCSSTTIKLVSSGIYKNRVNISMRLLDPNDDAIENAKYLCIPSKK